jgi:hypothetical protein
VRKFESSFEVYYHHMAGIEPPSPPKAPMPSPAGKEATPHRHEQLHSPPDPVEPVPVAIDAVAAAADTTADVDEPASMVTVLDIALVAMVLATAATEAVIVPFCEMAAAWKASKVLLALALIEKTIPFPQWEVGVFCLQ